LYSNQPTRHTNKKTNHGLTTKPISQPLANYLQSIKMSPFPQNITVGSTNVTKGQPQPGTFDILRHHASTPNVSNSWFASRCVMAVLWSHHSPASRSGLVIDMGLH